MMEKELRIGDYNNIDTFKINNYDVISVGNEGCLHRLPSLPQLERIAKKHRLKIVLPKLFNQDLVIIEHYLSEVISKCGDIEIVVNDFGSMRRFASLKGADCIAGRLLTKSFEEHPQAQVIAKRYPASWLQNILQSCILSKDKIQLLKSYDMKGVEINLLEYTEKALPSFLNEVEIEVHSVSNQSILAVFRQCPLNKKHILSNTCELTCQACKPEPLHFLPPVHLNITDIEINNISGFLDGNIVVKKIITHSSPFVNRLIDIDYLMD